MKRLVLIYCTIIGALFVSPLAIAQADSVKIGFVVKLPEEPWFQDEWRFADQAAKERSEERRVGKEC